MGVGRLGSEDIVSLIGDCSTQEVDDAVRKYLVFIAVSASPVVFEQGERILEKKSAAGYQGRIREEGLKEDGYGLVRVRFSNLDECLLAGALNSHYEKMKIREAEQQQNSEYENLFFF